MRKLSSFALLLLLLTAFSTAANAYDDPEHSPTWDRQYTCTYAQGPWTNEATNPGWSIFTRSNPNLIYGIEVYRATIPQGHDNRNIAFAKPENLCPLRDPDCSESGFDRTRWEFTITNGVQCTNTVVRDYGRRIVFSGCSNGKTRVCTY